VPRLFAALDPPGPARKAVNTLRTDDLDGARRTPPEQYHLTLRFFGDVGEEHATAVEDALADVDAEAPALRSTGLIALPSRRRPRVLAVTFARTEALKTLHEQVEAAARALGFEAETRRFRPHLTFARLNEADPQAVVRFLRTQPVPDVSFTASAFHLYESELRPDGARHQRRAAFALEGR
jgi:2'-5' RNA ligase